MFLRTLFLFFFGYVIFKVLGRLFFSPKRDFGYTADSGRKEGDVIIEHKESPKRRNKMTEDTEYVDFEEIE